MPRAAVVLLLLCLAVPASVPAEAKIYDHSKPWWTFRSKKCQDEPAAALVGMKLDDAMKTVRLQRLFAIRVLDRWTRVNLETVPERLTIVVHDNGVIVRAFCR